jgi:predicted aspartyl protease
LATLVGSVDQRRRPLIRIERTLNEDGFLALLDTGFNGELLVSIETVKRFGFELRDASSLAETAGGQVQRLLIGQATIMWLGQPRPVELLVAPEPARNVLPDDPIALIGTGLLDPHFELIDFAGKRIEIESQDT